MVSQFERAMGQMGVRIIHANSPQAKGRIENLFGTLQDRLVKELRLANIDDIPAANTFLQETFLPTFNARFCVTPQSDADLHRPLRPSEDVASILSVHSMRSVNRDFTIRFKNSWLQLTKVQPTLVLPDTQVIVEERLDDSLHIKLNDKYLTYQWLSSQPAPDRNRAPAIASDQVAIQQRTPTKPSSDHPWRKFSLLPYNITSNTHQKRLSKRNT